VISHLRLLLVLLLFACQAAAQTPIRIQEQRTIRLPVSSPPPAYELHLTAAFLEGTNWSAQEIRTLVTDSARILAQCNLGLTELSLVRISAPQRFHDYATGPARELARVLPLRRPTVYFVADTRQRPAFEAEAIGRGNSRTRPELADTVWVTRATRDPGIALAHELAHVLMNSGEHSAEEGNLMRDETTPSNTHLSATQCERLRSNALEERLIRRAP
jgi:hypothetical protein